jgi:hypothetical protein
VGQAGGTGWVVGTNSAKRQEEKQRDREGELTTDGGRGKHTHKPAHMRQCTIMHTKAHTYMHACTHTHTHTASNQRATLRTSLIPSTPCPALFSEDNAPLSEPTPPLPNHPLPPHSLNRPRPSLLLPPAAPGCRGRGRDGEWGGEGKAE